MNQSGNQSGNPANPPKPAQERLTVRDRLRLEAARNRLSQSNMAPANPIHERFLKAATKETPWQADIIRSPHLRQAYFGERRAAKTTTMGIAAIERCLRVANSKVLYVGLTQDSVRRIMYDEVFPSLLRAFPDLIDAELIGGDRLRFGNGSIVRLIGLDANSKEKEKVRGFKSSLNILDECQSFVRDTALILNEILGPAAADTGAKTIIGGTAGNSLGENYFYQITRHNTPDNPIAASIMHPEWMVYRFQWQNNTAIDRVSGNRICDNVRKYLDEQKRLHPGIETTDSWRQEWDAEWIVQTSSLIYRFSDDLVRPAPPHFFNDGCVYILGLDLGYNDPTAFTIVAYNSRVSNALHVVSSWAKSEMLIPEVVSKIKELDNQYHFAHMVGDSSSLQVFETLKQNYGFPIEKANRQGKLSHQQVLNGDMQSSAIYFLPGNTELIQQLKTVVWEPKDLKSGKYTEDPKYKNDLSDSFLYAHHFSRHFWYQAPAPKFDPGMYGTLENKRMVEMLFKRNNDQQNTPFTSITEGLDFTYPSHWK